MRTFARTMISIGAIAIIFLIVSAIPSAGNTVYKSTIKIIGKYDIFKNWFSILEKNIDWDAVMDSADIDTPQSIIAKPSGVLKELEPGSSGSIIFFGLLAVAAKSLIEAIITGSCSAIFKNILPGWTLLCNALGIVVGLLICSWLSNMGGSSALMSVLYSLVPIAVLCIGIAKVWGSTNAYNRNRGKKRRRRVSTAVSFFLVDVICGVITALASTMYASTLCLAAGRIISWVAIIISSVVYIIILILDYIRLKYRELRAANTAHIGWSDFI